MKSTVQNGASHPMLSYCLSRRVNLLK